MDYNLPGSSVHGILQARILKWIAIPFARNSQPRDQTQVFFIAGRFFFFFLLFEPLEVAWAKKIQGPKNDIDLVHHCIPSAWSKA